ncbi:MAG: tetratricopeptide repeat protein [Chloroflexi bacterium]|nr:tetratricopeptide repeat protein [Chloroflexota bacterium]
MKWQIPFVATKLAQPVISARILRRPRLVAKLRDILTRRLLLVCSGPGNGKTSLLAHLAELGYPVVWYSLGRSDRDLPVFLSHLMAGIARHCPDFGETWWSQIEDPHQLEKDIEVILSSLVNELMARVDNHITIVLDDYHTVEQSRGVNYAVNYLLSYLPPQVHVAIASRTAPYFPCLPRLRATGQVVTVEEGDLQFTAAEVAQLFAQIFDYPLDPPSLAMLLDQTGGWIIGLQLIGHSIRSNKTDTNLRAALAASKGTLFSYFAEEVLKKQQPDIQSFLKESSIFSRLNACECDAILGRSDSAKVLSVLERQCTLLLRLDDESYRYHSLFHDFLHEQLSLDGHRERALHRRAAAFLQNQGQDEHAIKHHLLAGDYAEAAVMISNLSEKLFQSGRFDSLFYFVNELPADISGKFPDLLMWAGKALELQGHFQEALSRYQKAENLYKGTGNNLGLSRILNSKGYVLLWARAEPGEAEDLHRQALNYLGSGSRLERATILNGLAFDMICEGNGSAALEFYSNALRIYVEEGDKLGEMRTLIKPGSILFCMRGDFAKALRLLEKAERLAIKLDAKRDLVECHTTRGAVFMFMGEYAKAIATSKKTIDLARPPGVSPRDIHRA